jgi:hypothetical protein
MAWKSILVVLTLTTVASAKEADEREFSCEKSSRYLDDCRKAGYEIANCVVGNGELTIRERKNVKMRRKTSRRNVLMNTNVKSSWRMKVKPRFMIPCFEWFNFNDTSNFEPPFSSESFLVWY